MMRSVYLVLALLLAGTSAWAGMNTLNAPVNLTARGDHEGAMAVANLKWQDESDNELGFRIFRSENAGKFELVATVGTNTTQYQDRVGLRVTGSFAWRVRAYNADGESDPSNTAGVWF